MNEVEVQRLFWIEKYQKSGDITYRNKIWQDMKRYCYKVMSNISHWQTENDYFYECEYYMLKGFEFAIRNFQTGGRVKWNTYLGQCIRSKLGNYQQLLNREYSKQQAEINATLLDPSQILKWTDPRDYAEGVIWQQDTKDFISCLDDMDKKIIQWVIEGESMYSIGKELHRDMYYIKSRCRKVGELYEEYMSG